MLSKKKKETIFNWKGFIKTRRDGFYDMPEPESLKSLILEFKNHHNLNYPINLKLTTGIQVIQDYAHLDQICTDLEAQNPGMDIYDLALELVILNSDGNELVSGLTWREWSGEVLRKRGNQMNLLELILDFRQFSLLKYPFYIDLRNIKELPSNNYIENRQDLKNLIDTLLQLNFDHSRWSRDLNIRNSDGYNFWIDPYYAIFMERERQKKGMI